MTDLAGRYVDYAALPPELKEEARRNYPKFRPEDFAECAFYVKLDGHVAKNRHRLTDAALRKITAMCRGDDVRSKTDLNNWTGSPTFHIDRSPPLRRKT